MILLNAQGAVCNKKKPGIAKYCSLRYSNWKYCILLTKTWEEKNNFEWAEAAPDLFGNTKREIITGKNIENKRYGPNGLE